MHSSESPPIIVLGAERSGTSVVAEMVHRLGYLEFLNIQEALLKAYRELEHR